VRVLHGLTDEALAGPLGDEPAPVTLHRATIVHPKASRALAARVARSQWFNTSPTRLHALRPTWPTSALDPYGDLVVALACLAHDFGKASTTAFVDGRWRAYGHEEAGIESTRQWLADAQFGDVDGVRRSRLIDDVVPLVASHLAPVQFFKSPPAIAPFAAWHSESCGSTDSSEFPTPTRVDAPRSTTATSLPASGSSNAPRVWTSWLRKPEPLLRGRDLKALGLAPGPHFGALIDAALEAQLDGEIANRDEAVTWMRRRLEADGD